MFGTDLEVHPIHLGLGATAASEPLSPATSTGTRAMRHGMQAMEPRAAWLKWNLGSTRSTRRAYGIRQTLPVAQRRCS